MSFWMLLSQLGIFSFACDSSLFALTPPAREGFRVFSRHGQLVDIHGEVLHTRWRLFSQAAPFIIQDNKLYGTEVRDLDFVDHWNLSMGRPLQAAGYWIVNRGVLKNVTFESTTKIMTPEEILKAKKFLQNMVSG